MKVAFTILLILGFTGIAVFGFAAMGHNDGSHGSCIAATAQGIVCPDAMSALDFASFHVSTFRSFTTAIFDGNILTALLLSITLSVLVGLGFLASAFNSPSLNFANRYRLSPAYSSPLEKELTRWLALHENSPSAV